MKPAQRTYSRPRRAQQAWLAVALMALLSVLTACVAPAAGSGQAPNIQATVDAALKATSEAKTSLQAAIQSGIAGTATAEAGRRPTGAPAPATATLAPTSLSPMDTPTTMPTAAPVATPVPAATTTLVPPVATEAPAPPIPPTPIPPTDVPDASVRSGTVNMRSGPGTDFGIVNTYPQGARLDTRGRTADGSWIQVTGPDGLTGWISATVLDVNVALSAIPVAWSAPPPTPIPPTPIPTTAAPTRTPTRASTTAPAPQASFRVNDTNGKWPHRVQFTDTSTNAVSWAWNFGDGTTSSTRNPTHTYERAGSYRAELTVANSAGQRSTYGLAITVDSRFGERAETLIGPFGSYATGANFNRQGELALMKYCPTGQVAIGFNIKVQGPQGSGDDTALNAIRLTCGRTSPSGATVADEEGGVGSWANNSTTCPSGSFLASARLRVDLKPIDKDYVGATNASFICTDGTARSFSHGAEYGTWMDYQRCPTDTVICGINTHTGHANPVNFRNEMGLVDATFACCYSR